MAPATCFDPRPDQVPVQSQEKAGHHATAALPRLVMLQPREGGCMKRADNHGAWIQ